MRWGPRLGSSPPRIAWRGRVLIPEIARLISRRPCPHELRLSRVNEGSHGFHQSLRRGSALQADRKGLCLHDRGRRAIRMRELENDLAPGAEIRSVDDRVIHSSGGEPASTRQQSSLPEHRQQQPFLSWCNYRIGDRIVVSRQRRGDQEYAQKANAQSVAQ